MDNDLLKISTWNMQHFGLENADFSIQNLNIFAIQPLRLDCWTRFGKNNKKNILSIWSVEKVYHLFPKY